MKTNEDRKRVQAREYYKLVVVENVCSEATCPYSHLNHVLSKHLILIFYRFMNSHLGYGLLDPGCLCASVSICQSSHEWMSNTFCQSRWTIRKHYCFSYLIHIYEFFVLVSLQQQHNKQKCVRKKINENSSSTYFIWFFHALHN